MQFLYVVSDPEKGLTKIGISKRVTKRLAMHRKRVPAVVLIGKWEAGCEFVATTKEGAALRRLARRADRDHGDWFRCSPDMAIEIVEKVCG